MRLLLPLSLFVPLGFFAADCYPIAAAILFTLLFSYIVGHILCDAITRPPRS